ncbi:hypothetical protein EJ03DRAFT_159363 [Teratosphaeria nubilosa]|uniref:Uncharacterized protein n=1 Tax=Teratosphaeria nubilosa TaxID=161662 RepID=A0A6G1L312_9PEZI|nr:hypothetical protein EJ03DRAFT_159363 [Teratosphaeria nubilosa]
MGWGSGTSTRPVAASRCATTYLACTPDGQVHDDGVMHRRIWEGITRSSEARRQKLTHACNSTWVRPLRYRDTATCMTLPWWNRPACITVMIQVGCVLPLSTMLGGSQVTAWRHAVLQILACSTAVHQISDRQVHTSVATPYLPALARVCGAADTAPFLYQQL